MPRVNDQAPPPSRKPNVGRLNSPTSVRQEMARVYRQARRGEISETAYARLVDPEGFERREPLDKTLDMIERSGRKFMPEIHNLLPPQLVNAPPNDQRAAAVAEKLAEAEFQRAQTESRVVGAEPHAIPPLSERITAAAAEMGA